LFSVYYRKNDLDYPRLGITLKGRYASVSRTRIKRVVREWFRLRKMAFINMDLNVVVKAPPQFNKLFLDSLRNDLEKIEQKP
jgi:ribonuclease P protein component